MAVLSLKTLIPPQKLIEKIILASILPSVAGAVNVCGFFMVGDYTSHLSGKVARLGEEIGMRDWPAARFYLAIILCFLLGAFTATLLIEIASRLNRQRYALPLFIEANIFIFIMIIASTPHRYPFISTHMLACAFSFSMGLQNALVTQISGAIIRTTHLTGIITDVGIELVRMFFWIYDQVKKRRLLTGIFVIYHLHRDFDFKRIPIHITILISFLTGAALGQIAYLHYGVRTMIVPCFILMLLAFLDLTRNRRIGFGKIHIE